MPVIKDKAEIKYQEGNTRPAKKTKQPGIVLPEQ
jgi:hypothetical protein